LRRSPCPACDCFLSSEAINLSGNLREFALCNVRFNGHAWPANIHRHADFNS
jgi:hypothetical protein